MGECEVESDFRAQPNDTGFIQLRERRVNAQPRAAFDGFPEDLPIPGFDPGRHLIENVLAALANLLAGVIFAFAAHVDWAVVALIVPGAIIGGTLGARYGRRLPPAPLRALIVAVGIVAIVRLL